MNLTEAKSAPVEKQRRTRVGRGRGSGKGKTCGKGHRGMNVRSGARKRVSYEGGQMPLFRRLPKRGFNNARFRTEYALVNVRDLGRFPENAVVDPEALYAAKLIRRKRVQVRILGDGEIAVPLTVKAHGFSASAREKIQSAGGRVEVLKRSASVE